MVRLGLEVDMTIVTLLLRELRLGADLQQPKQPPGWLEQVCNLGLYYFGGALLCL